MSSNNNQIINAFSLKSIQPKENNAYCSFISLYRAYHSPQKYQENTNQDFFKIEKVFLSHFNIGIFETYDFLYGYCHSDDEFKQWITDKMGKKAYLEAVEKFNSWYVGMVDCSDQTFSKILNADQLEFWDKNGYLRIPGLVNEDDCNRVIGVITEMLGLNLKQPSSWYGQHDLLQGIMLQLYQNEHIAKIKNSDSIRQVFEQLYQTDAIIANTEKLGYNPPETDSFNFRGSPLHWDIDFSTGIKYHIQGLVYLNDVPEERGALSLIPGFQHEINSFLQMYAHPDHAIDVLRQQNRQIAVAGNKGDLILWLETLPHAATANRSNHPRFVQYISFTKL
ncbi:phytanoyl-CoA dioxygenase family protein [Pedobacter sp. GR22-10]|uniref:phytanoyl-CoA dioxygenase family protein n=1 Tax=Pedobacter sp. GR22-10 TaxID=2994472 RepID=UPI002245F93F|nr:phytanoyl-CoA dioxygenase family protein [Pedobacter sp. GR22-10]MCX2432389.1 phytanoyl-CoA dioxygenase family protein [Pedobacter sp. GR22-10]